MKINKDRFGTFVRAMLGSIIGSAIMYYIFCQKGKL